MLNALPKALAVPPLRSGGVMLTYQCNLRCRHCGYRCRPDAGGWMDDATLELAMETLAGERRLIDVHLAGGEPILNPPLLLKAVRLAVAKGVRLSYMETNGSFATSVERARELLLPLREAGLPAILLSVSPYHNEGVPLRRTLNALEAGLDVFGADGVFPWLGHFLSMLERMDPEVTHDLRDFMAANGMEWGDGELLRLFPLTPGGRAPEGLDDFFVRRPADFFAGGHCLEMLTGVDHFHIDPNGNLFTGHCPGIVSGRLGDMHAPKRPDRHPVFVALATGGPHALMETARNACGFEPDARGYASPCDLCFQVRRALLENDPRGWPELGPDEYYG